MAIVEVRIERWHKRTYKTWTRSGKIEQVGVRREVLSTIAGIAIAVLLVVLTISAILDGLQGLQDTLGASAETFRRVGEAFRGMGS